MSRAQLLAARFFGVTATRDVQAHCTLAVTYNSDGYVPVSVSKQSDFEMRASGLYDTSTRTRSHDASGYALEGLGSSSRPPSARGLSSHLLEPGLWR